MIMNLRPANGSGLNTILEEMGDRFSEDQQEEILVIIGEVLGTPDGAAERKVMADNAKEARMEQFKEEVQQGEDMEVDG
jgi:succinyl-CoA synthetase alpha subunit